MESQTQKGMRWPGTMVTAPLGEPPALLTERWSLCLLHSQPARVLRIWKESNTELAQLVSLARFKSRLANYRLAWLCTCLAFSVASSAWPCPKHWPLRSIISWELLSMPTSKKPGHHLGFNHDVHWLFRLLILCFTSIDQTLGIQAHDSLGPHTPFTPCASNTDVITSLSPFSPAFLRLFPEDSWSSLSQNHQLPMLL